MRVGVSMEGGGHLCIRKLPIKCYSQLTLPSRAAFRSPQSINLTAAVAADREFVYNIENPPRALLEPSHLLVVYGAYLPLGPML